MSQRIRITAKRRDDIDVDALVALLIRVVMQSDTSQPQDSRPQPDSKGGGDKPGHEEPAA